jgi:hypothetical protein
MFAITAAELEAMIKVEMDLKHRHYATSPIGSNRISLHQPSSEEVLCRSLTKMFIELHDVIKSEVAKTNTVAGGTMIWPANDSRARDAGAAVT